MGFICSSTAQRRRNSSMLYTRYYSNQSTWEAAMKLYSEDTAFVSHYIGRSDMAATHLHPIV